jgi:hypothetical protein
MAVAAITATTTARMQVSIHANDNALLCNREPPVRFVGHTESYATTANLKSNAVGEMFCYLSRHVCAVSIVCVSIQVRSGHVRNATIKCFAPA